MTTAFLGLDYIVDIMCAGGKPARCASEAARRDVVARANATAAFCRSHGWPVIWVKVGFSPGYPEWPATSPLFGGAREAGALQLGEPGTAFAPGLVVQSQDAVVIKHRVSPFYATGLETILRARGVTRLLVGGVSTAWAVQSAVRDAHDRDYLVWVVEDACAAASVAEHDTSLALLATIASCIRSDDLASLLT